MTTRPRLLLLLVLLVGVSAQNIYYDDDDVDDYDEDELAADDLNAEEASVEQTDTIEEDDATKIPTITQLNFHVSTQWGGYNVKFSRVGFYKLFWGHNEAPARAY